MERTMTPYQCISGILGLVGCLMSSGCASVSKGEVALDLGIKDRGVASWYGKEFHGRVAANGETFDMTALTAAHRRLPLGSVVRVVNLINGKQVHVRINDRGPYVAGRMLDLSYAAAVELDMVDAGISIVHIEVIGQLHPIAPTLQSSDPIITAWLFRRGPQSGKRSEVVRAKELPTRLRIPQPIERLFPREILHARRERRHAAVLVGDHTLHSPVPSLVV